MRIAEQVTFGGSGLDRAAHLRGDAAAQAKLWADPGAGVLALWRGKPLFDGAAAGWLAPGHVVLEHERGVAFLGLGDAGPLFAADISGWEPPDPPTDPTAFFDPSEQHHPALPETARFAELRGQMARLSARDAECAAMARGLFAWHETHGFCARCGSPSAISHAGWQRTCPACGAQHFPRTDPVVIMLVTRGNRALVGRSAGWPEGMYSLLAGFVEPGEPIEAAVRREVFEETGVSVGAVRYLASQPWPFPSSLMFGCHAEALDDVITLDPAELEAARWMSREEAAQAMAGEHPEVKPARRGAIAHFLLRNWLADRLD